MKKRYFQHGETGCMCVTDSVLSSPWREVLDVLDCLACHRVFPVSEMYTIDACSAECQRKVDAMPDGTPAPQPEQAAG